jgi:predicted nuclease of predicted toxin-antitoxin system
MKLLLDEDSQSNALVRLLLAANHDVETATGAGIAGSGDAVVLDYAKCTERVLLTRNGRDFLLLHASDKRHSGILIEYRGADPTKNMTRQQIVAAIGNIEASGWNLSGQIISINAWR